MIYDRDVAFQSYLISLKVKKPVILTGDLNVAYQEIDIHNPKSNNKSAGFTKEERESFGRLLSNGFTDVYRHLYPTEKNCYTYWSHRFQAREKGLGYLLRNIQNNK